MQTESAMPDAPAAPNEEVLKRLRRIEGQVRGVARMVEDGRDCREVLQQLTAIRSATNQVSRLMARSYACQCLSDSKTSDDPAALMDDLLNVLSQAA
jgi:CsoR family transcriptional regulator, copper-sensing transcriptional repressor